MHSQPQRLLPILIVVLLCGGLSWAQEEAPEEPPERWGEERVVVTAEVEGAESAPAGASTTVLEPTRSPDPPQALADLVALAPAVSENGQGGLFQNVSIRGVSRQRVRQLISGVRITDERRAGPSTSFIDPLLMQSVEVLRGPATTFHGSGALGGTIQVTPRRFNEMGFQSGWSSAGDERFLVAGAGGEHWSFGVARRQQNDAEATDGTRLFNRFEQTSAVLRFDWGNAEKRRYELMILPSRGNDIGKANTDFPTRTTTYPDERHDLVELSVLDPDGWTLRASIHDRALTTRVDQSQQLNRVESESTDLGLSWDRSNRIGAGESSVRWGADLFSRVDVASTETIVDLNPMPLPDVIATPVDGGRESEWGGFAVFAWNGGGADWQAGLRLSHQTQGNIASPSLDRNAVNGFVGVTKPFGERWELRGAASSGERFPSLGELYFSGVTGRGEVFGNPDLDSERALNTELGFAYKGATTVLRAAIFRTQIDDYIERIEFAPDMLTFVNLTSGRIEGLELSAVRPIGKEWLFTWGGHLMQARAADGTPLSDTPPHELWGELRWYRERWTATARWAHRATKADPGSGELPTSAADLLSVSARFQMNDAWAFYGGLRNGLDERYVRSADEKAPPAAERALSLGLVWSGR